MPRSRCNLASRSRSAHGCARPHSISTRRGAASSARIAVVSWPCWSLGLWQGYGAWLLAAVAAMRLTPHCSRPLLADRRRSSRCRRCCAQARRRASREASEVAVAAGANSRPRVRDASARCLPLDAALCWRAPSACACPSSPRSCSRRNCRGPIRSCWRTPRSGWRCGSSGAWPSNARCWRAPRPGGVVAPLAAAVPPLVLLSWRWPRTWTFPPRALVLLLLEASGCWLLWRVARVEI